MLIKGRYNFGSRNKFSVLICDPRLFIQSAVAAFEGTFILMAEYCNKTQRTAFSALNKIVFTGNPSCFSRTFLNRNKN